MGHAWRLTACRVDPSRLPSRLPVCLPPALAARMPLGLPVTACRVPSLAECLSCHGLPPWGKLAHPKNGPLKIITKKS